jgi:uncharacterized iron-regulated membrane protein
MVIWAQPRRSRVRHWLFQAHLWTGLAIGLVMAVVGITGSLLVFKPELERWMVAEMTLVRPTGPRVPVDVLVETLRRERPAYRISNLYVYRAPELAWNFRATDADGTRVQVYVDQYTGKIVGEDFFRGHFLDWAYELHEALLLGRTGLVANAIFAWLMVLLSVTGMVIWWPGRKHWRKGFRYHAAASWKGQTYDLHKLGGLASAALLVIVSVTGAYYAFPDAYRRVVAGVTDTAATAPTPKSRVTARTATVEQIYEAAVRAMPEAEPQILFFPQKPDGIYSLRMRLPGDWVRTGNHHVYLDQYSGAVIRPDYYHARPLGARVIGANGPLHFGTFGGNATRVLWVALGLSPGVLFGTGAVMYWNRVWGKRRAAKRRLSPALAAGD